MVVYTKNEKNLVVPSSLGNIQTNGGGGSGVTPAQVQQMIDSSLTEYDETVQGYISGVTDDVEQNKEDIQDLSGTTSALTEGLNSLYGAVSSIGEDIVSLSAQTAQITAITAQIESISGTTEQNSQDIAELSATTSEISSDVNSLGTKVESLSGITSGISNDLSSLGTDVENLSGATIAIDGKFENYTTTAVTAELSAATSGIAVDLQTLSAYTENIPTGYTLPIASENVLGGVMVGSGLAIDSGGTLSVSGGTSGPNVYVLNLMSQEDRAALYTELMSYFDNYAPSSAFPIDNYVFYWYLPSNNPIGDDFRGYAQMYIAQLHPSDYGGSVFFTGVIGIRQNQDDIYKLRFIITANGGTDSGILKIKNVEVNPNNFSWTGNLYYDADNSRFLRGENVLDPAANADSFGSSDSIDNIILNGISTDSGAPGRILPPVFKVYITSGGTTQMYTSPQIIGIDIAQITVDNQTYSRKYSFIYTKEDGNRFIIKMCLNGNQYATGFEYIEIQ